jgi:hypothetical protein
MGWDDYDADDWVVVVVWAVDTHLRPQYYPISRPIVHTPVVTDWTIMILMLVSPPDDVRIYSVP